MAKIQTLGKRASESAVKVMPKLYVLPIVNLATIQEWTGFTRAGAQTVINRFIEKGILFPKIKIGNTDNPMSIRNISTYLSVTIDAYNYFVPCVPS